MRLCGVLRGLTIAALALVVAYGYLLEVRAPCWPVWPVELRAVAEFAFLVVILIALVTAVLTAHCTDLNSSH